MRNTTSPGLHEKLIAALLFLVWLWAAIKPLDRGDWLLENLLVFASFAILVLTRKRFRFSALSYWLFALFMCLHLYGSHYTYAETPLGYWVQTVFDLQRNHYDRAVHFLFGVLICYPMMELIGRKTGLQGSWLTLFTLTTILSFSALYELVEMIAAVVVAPDLGTAFLGTQGDEWDAQKDTGLAFMGAISTLLFSRLMGLSPLHQDQ